MQHSDNPNLTHEQENFLDDCLEFEDVLDLDNKKINQSNLDHLRRSKIDSPTLPPKHRSDDELKMEKDCEELLRKTQDAHLLVDGICENQSLPLSADTKEHLLKQKQILITRETQLFMVLYVLANHHSSNFHSEFDHHFGSLQGFKIPLERLEQSLNYTILQEVHAKQKNYIDEFLVSIKELQAVLAKNDKEAKGQSRILKTCKILISKITTIIEIYPYACTHKHDDLFSLNKNLSKRWAKLRSCMRIRILGDKKAVQEGFDQLRDGLNFVNAMMSKMSEVKNVDFKKSSDFLDVIKGSFSVVQYALMKSKAKRKSELLIANPNSQLAKDIWNLPETGIMKNLLEAILPKIVYSDLIWVPREYKPISAQLVAAWNKNKNFSISQEDYENPQVLAAYERQKCMELWKECPNVNERIPLRINSPSIIPKVHKEDPGFFKKPQFFEKIESIFKKNTDLEEAVIFHIHGGGFISMSSHVHQAYTRHWANNLKAAIFSVDYRKAPLHPYPEGLDDCLQVYLWLLHYMDKVFQHRYKKIVIVGDSAGGNLVASLTALLIKLNLRIPDGICLVYPALNLNYNNYTPSLLSALDDMILPHTFLKICLQAYIQDKQFNPEFDPFLSPIKCSNELLSKFPPTRIFVGNVDPFHDDCCRLAEKLQDLGRDVYLTVYDNFPHGFLQFDNPPKGNKYCKTAISEVEEALAELIKS